MIKKINFQVGATASAMNAEGLQDRMIRSGLDPVDVDLQLNDYYDFLVEHGASAEKIQVELLDQLDGVIKAKEAQNFARARINEFSTEDIPF